MVCYAAAYQKRKTHNVHDCHALLCGEVYSLFLFVSRCISGCHLYLRSDHFKAADCTLETNTHKEESGFLVRLIYRFLDVTDGSSFWIIVSCCSHSYCSDSDKIFYFVCFLLTKERQILWKPEARFMWIQCCILSSTYSRGRAERTHTHIRTYSNKHSVSSSGSHTLCGWVIFIIMKLGVCRFSFRSRWVCFVHSLQNISFAGWFWSGTLQALPLWKSLCFLLSAKTAFLLCFFYSFFKLTYWSFW